MLIESPGHMMRCGSRMLDLSTPVVMGIVNVTTDSFYPASRTNFNIQVTLDMAKKMISEGAQILDIGGMSSRPGSKPITPGEELERIIPAIQSIHEALPGAIISVDTYRAEVALQAIKAGAHIINDISGGELDKDLWDVVAEYQLPYVLMHMRGTPENMQSLTDYQDVIGELVKYFVNKVRLLKSKGIADIIIDPGFGFAKTMQQNYELIRRLAVFQFLDRPLMIGLSRKSTLSHTIKRPVEDTLHATTALHMASLINGASILRTHDVQAAMDAIAVYNQLSST